MYTLIATGIGLLAGSYVHYSKQKKQRLILFIGSIFNAIYIITAGILTYYYPNLFDKPLTFLMPILMITLITGLVNEVYKKRIHCK